MDLLNDVKRKLETKLKTVSYNNYYFYFKGKMIDLSKFLRIKDFIGNKNQILIIGISKQNKSINKRKKCYESKKRKSRIVCSKCLDNYNINNSCLINFEDYKIILSDCNKGHRISDILIEDFEAKIFNNHNDIYYKCNIHQNEIFCSYCTKCKENLCFICENNHSHKNDIISFNQILFNSDDYIKNLTAKMINFENKINKLMRQIERIKGILNYFMKHLEKYYSLIFSIIDNYDINKRNYWMIQNLKQINIDNVLEDIDKIIKNKKLNEKFNYVLSIYNKMKYKNEIKIQYKYSNKTKFIRLFGEKFIEKNKKNCKLVIDDNETDLIEFYENKEMTPKNDKFEIILKNIDKLTDMSNMFNNCSLLVSIPDLPKLNMSSVINISHFFYNCSSFKSLPDISEWDTSSLTDMSYLFYNCQFIEKLPDISKWNTSSVINMSHLFTNCKSLKELPDISEWDISLVKDITSMFSSCFGLSYLPDISNWNTSSVLNMSYLFNFCSSLKILPDLSKWDLSSCINTSYMFSDCISLKSLPDISKWNVSSVNNMKKMFSFCKSLKNLPDISNWNTSSVCDMSYLFAHCYSLQDLPDISKWNTSCLVKIDNMFSFCNSLNYLPDISNWNVSNIKSMKDIFLGCDKLESKPEFKENKNCLII